MTSEYEESIFNKNFISFEKSRTTSLTVGELKISETPKDNSELKIDVERFRTINLDHILNIQSSQIQNVKLEWLANGQYFFAFKQPGNPDLFKAYVIDGVEIFAHQRALSCKTLLATCTSKNWIFCASYGSTSQVLVDVLSNKLKIEYQTSVKINESKQPNEQSPVISADEKNFYLLNDLNLLVFNHYLSPLFSINLVFSTSNFVYLPPEYSLIKVHSDFAFLYTLLRTPSHLTTYEVEKNTLYKKDEFPLDSLVFFVQNKAFALDKSDQSIMLDDEISFKLKFETPVEHVLVNRKTNKLAFYDSKNAIIYELDNRVNL